MTVDLDAAVYTLSGMRPFPVAVTTVHEGGKNGLISLSAGSAGIIHEAPRVQIGIRKYNFSHDLVLYSGIFVDAPTGKGRVARCVAAHRSDGAARAGTETR